MWAQWHGEGMEHTGAGLGGGAGVAVSHRESGHHSHNASGDALQPHTQPLCRRHTCTPTTPDTLLRVITKGKFDELWSVAACL